MDSVIIDTSRSSCHVTSGNGSPTRRSLDADGGGDATRAISELCSMNEVLCHIY